jgi:hypothetical protein
MNLHVVKESLCGAILRRWPLEQIEVYLGNMIAVRFALHNEIFQLLVETAAHRVANIGRADPSEHHQAQNDSLYHRHVI